MVATAQGGNFLQGFAGSAIGALGGGLASGGDIAGTYGDGIPANQLARALISGAAGCAGAMMSGGKCADAAVSAAFASLYNGDGGWAGARGGINRRWADVNDTAAAALNEANPKSIGENVEYGGLIFAENGEFGVTSSRGSTLFGINAERSLNLGTWIDTFNAGYDGIRIVVGTFHTHGDYSNSSGARTNSVGDQFDSNAFSEPDLRGNAHKFDSSNGVLKYNYLGTPSGVFIGHEQSGIGPFDYRVICAGKGRC